MKLLVTALFLISSTISVAGVKLKDVVLKDDRIIIEYSGLLNGSPELTLDNGKLQVAIPDAVAWPKIEKNLDVNGEGEKKLTAYQYTKDLVRVRAYLPYNFAQYENNIHLSLTNNKIEVLLPKKMLAALGERQKKKPTAYDEKLLDQLIIDQKESKVAGKEISATKVNVTKKNTESLVEEVFSGAKEDTVNTSQSSTDFLVDNKEETKTKGFSVVDYLGKFVAFVGVLLLGLYGVIVLMKKGVIKKGKLGFLNNTDVVKVLNTTHIAPKRSLMLVKAHKQVFLLSSSENGVQMLSEVDDVTGLIKEGELSLTGSNFDSNVQTAEATAHLGDTVQLKKDITQSTPVNLKKNESKFSDKLREKVKELKPLQ